MQEFLTALTQVGTSLWNLLVISGRPLLPWTPLAAWVVFWLFAVNWVKLRTLLAEGGWVVGLLLGVFAVLVWGTVAPYEGTHPMFGLRVSNFVEKTIYVSILTSIAFLAGSVQMSGNITCCRLTEAEDDANHDHDAHGHDPHGHDAHGHGAHAHDSHGHEVPHAVVQPALH